MSYVIAQPKAPPLEGDKLLAKKPVAAYLAVHGRTLSRMVKDGRFPRPDVQLSPTAPRWRLSTVQAFIAGK